MPRKLIDAASLPVRDLWLHDDTCAGRPVRAVLVEDIEKAEAVEVPRWIPVTERLPKAEQPVLVVYMFGNKPMVTKAIYEDGTILSDDSFLNWPEIWEYGNYDEESESYFIPRGWWEYGDFAEFNNGINCPITHWMPLPEPAEVE